MSNLIKLTDNYYHSQKVKTLHFKCVTSTLGFQSSAWGSMLVPNKRSLFICSYIFPKIFPSLLLNNEHVRK